MEHAAVQWKDAEKKLLVYGISIGELEVYREDFLYCVDENLLSLVMVFLNRREYLPKLKSLLETLDDKDLCFRGENALMWAAGSALSCEKLLLLRECKPHFVAGRIHSRGHCGRTALHCAAGGTDDSAETIHLLVEWGADVNALDNDLWTPLHTATLCDQSYANRWAALLGCGADPSLREVNGVTAEEIMKYGIPVADAYDENGKAIAGN